MKKKTTREWLENKRTEQGRAEMSGDYKRVRDILKEIQDFGLKDVYNRK